MKISTKTPRLVESCDEIREAVGHARLAGETIGVVPTMGALHEGHLSLVRTAREDCTFNVTTIFVNPAQFGPNEDLAQYPRTFEADLDALAQYDVDLVFLPSVEEMYPDGFSTFVDPPDVASPLEGQCRPGHFRGVATVVLKLLTAVPADRAYFGEKDYQQLLVIRKMVADLNLPVTVCPCPIVREVDGLALSSRNTYLSGEERQQGLALSRSLRVADELVQSGERNANMVRSAMRHELDEAGVMEVDYIAIADMDTLHPVELIDRPCRALVAARVGQTRLIDNCQIG